MTETTSLVAKMRQRQMKVKPIGDNRARRLVAGDIGGTKTLLGLFSRAPERPAAIEVGEFATLDYDGVVPMIREFLKGRGIEARRIAAATFGVAGAITDQV